MAFFAGYIGVGRFEVSDVLGRHGMAGGPAEGWRIGVLPAVDAGKSHNQYQDDDRDDRQNIHPARRIGWWKEKILQFGHGTSPPVGDYKAEYSKTNAEFPCRNVETPHEMIDFQVTFRVPRRRSIP